MWIVSQHGFYNIIQYEEDKAKDLLTVKARRKEDLDAFKEMMPDGDFGPIENYELADYAYRMKGPRQDVTEAVNSMVDCIDYHKTKDRLRQTHPDRMAIYYGVWRTLAALQEDTEEDYGFGSAAGG